MAEGAAKLGAPEKRATERATGEKTTSGLPPGMMIPMMLVGRSEGCRKGNRGVGARGGGEGGIIDRKEHPRKSPRIDEEDETARDESGTRTGSNQSHRNDDAWRAHIE